KILELVGKRTVGKRKLPARGFRRSHLRQHAMQRETLGAVAAAKALDGQLAVAPHDFEDEQVLPFGPGRMQPGHALPGAGEREETIVLHGSLPEIGRYRAVSQ